MNQSTGPINNISAPATRRKLALVLGGLGLLSAMMMCMCVGLMVLWPDGDDPYPDYSHEEYDSYDDHSSGHGRTGTGIFVNGFELTPDERYALEQIVGPIETGRYWLDNQGYFGYEGGPALGNLYTLAEGSSGNGFNRSPDGSLYSGTDGDTGYFFDSDTGCSVVGGEVSC